MDALSSLHEGRRFLVGDQLSLADIHLAPIFDYFQSTPDSAPILQQHAGLVNWWKEMSTRDSMRNTPFLPG